MDEEIISLGENQSSLLNTNICVQMNCLFCVSLLCFFAGTAGKGRRPRCGQHLALLSGGEMLNQAISVPKVSQGDNSQEHRGTCYESGENKEITEPWF